MIRIPMSAVVTADVVTELTGYPCSTEEATAIFYDKLTTEEIARLTQLLAQPLFKTTWGEVRTERDRRLAACDWTQLADAPFDEAKKNEWKKYRKDLRDVPQKHPNPDAVVWPEAPK